MKKSNKKGFTIVELVIVIAVIAILAAVMIPTFGGVIEKANKSAVQQAATSLYKEAYALDLADGNLDGKDGEDDIYKVGDSFVVYDVEYDEDGKANISFTYVDENKDYTSTLEDNAWNTEKSTVADKAAVLEAKVNYAYEKAYDLANADEAIAADEEHEAEGITFKFGANATTCEITAGAEAPTGYEFKFNNGVWTVEE